MERSSTNGARYRCGNRKGTRRSQSEVLSPGGSRSADRLRRQGTRKARLAPANLARGALQDDGRSRYRARCCMTAVVRPSDRRTGRALVTGIGGFTGRHLVDHLAELGYEVWGTAAPG